MSEFISACGHRVDGHCLTEITKEGLKAFKIFQRWYGKKPIPIIIERGGGFLTKYLAVGEIKSGESVICSSCFSEWEECV